MAENRIRDMRVRAGLTQGEVADRLPDDVNRVVMSFIESGKVLPTASSMRELCEMFRCTPSDLYDPSDLDLMTDDPAKTDSEPQKKPANRGRGHDGMTEFRIWMSPSEKEALEKAVLKLGYRNTTEWFREAFRTLLEKCRALRIAEYDSILNIQSGRQNQGA